MIATEGTAAGFVILNHFMKTISFDDAKVIISRLNVEKNSWLDHFYRTGSIGHNKNYHLEIDIMLANPHQYLKKQMDGIHKLKKYFNKHAPLLKQRDPANIKDLEYPNQRYQGESIRIQLTWSELIITDSMGEVNSISLDDAKELAKEILKY